MDADQYVVEFPDGYLVRTFLEAVLAAIVLLWCARRLRRGTWAVAAGTGALGYFVTAGLWCYVAVAARNGTRSQVAGWVLRHSTALDWVRLAGLALLLVSVTLMRRAGGAAAPVPAPTATPTPTSS